MDRPIELSRPKELNGQSPKAEEGLKVFLVYSTLTCPVNSFLWPPDTFYPYSAFRRLNTPRDLANKLHP